MPFISIPGTINGQPQLYARMMRSVGMKNFPRNFQILHWAYPGALLYYTQDNLKKLQLMR